MGSMGSAGPLAGALAGADGAAITRADPTARTAVAQEALREGLPTTNGATDVAAAGPVLAALASPAGLDSGVDELTARALIASSISFTISDPRRPDDPLVWVNPAFERMTGYAAHEVVGRNCRMLQGPGTDRAAVRRLREALQRGEGVRAELLNYRKDGSPFWNSFTISPVLDGEGELTHFVGVQTDVTARVIAGIEYERLLAAERDARTVAERARGRLDVIVEVGAVLTETLDATDAMRRLAARARAGRRRLLRHRPDGAARRPARPERRDRRSDPAAPPPETLRVADDLLRNSRRVAAAHQDEDLAAALAAMRILPAGAPGAPGAALPAVALTGAEPVVRSDLGRRSGRSGPRATRTRSRSPPGCGPPPPSSLRCAPGDA